jgi:cobalamin biosynthesis Mg chelatase CobN
MHYILAIFSDMTFNIRPQQRVETMMHPKRPICPWLFHLLSAHGIYHHCRVGLEHHVCQNQSTDARIRSAINCRIAEQPLHASHAASTRASNEVPLRNTCARDTTVDDASTASATATRFLFSSSMQSDVAIGDRRSPISGKAGATNGSAQHHSYLRGHGLLHMQRSMDAALSAQPPASLSHLIGRGTLLLRGHV